MNVVVLHSALILMHKGVRNGEGEERHFFGAYYMHILLIGSHAKLVFSFTFTIVP